MKYNPDKHHRQSIRLKGYDYSQAGAYFVTVCSQNRECLFGDVVNGEMALNDAGRTVQTVWDKLSNRFHYIELDEYVIMPNHIHGIVIIVGAPLVGAQSTDAVQSTDGPQSMVGNFDNRAGTRPDNRAGTRPAPTLMALGDIVGAFKSIATNEYICGIAQHGWPRFDGKLWQRNYWEHIVRNENELNRIREYIINNPAEWKSDHLYSPLSGFPNMVRELASEYTVEGWMV